MTTKNKPPTHDPAFTFWFLTNDATDTYTLTLGIYRRKNDFPERIGIASCIACSTDVPGYGEDDERDLATYTLNTGHFAGKATLDFWSGDADADFSGVNRNDLETLSDPYTLADAMTQMVEELGIDPALVGFNDDADPRLVAHWQVAKAALEVTP